jgi:hypothetical protein
LKIDILDIDTHRCGWVGGEFVFDGTVAGAEMK